ncbi:hypothetical protein FHG87_018106 [Trinorchestia longiramus]|nr:hypothetical protein FHG87_018106 [Trinorchestia longiramus]
MTAATRDAVSTERVKLCFVSEALSIFLPRQKIKLISLERRRLQGQLIDTYKYLSGLKDVTLDGLFERDGNIRARNNG